jgi:dTDP-4-amino-4,6-dideoxygalactose transaminase
LRGAKPVFIDVQEETFNLHPSLIEECITTKTKAIIPVHYAGVSCDMDPILAVANHHNLHVVEDAAQSILSTYKGRMVGTLGNMSTLSFHETKNIISGEGGALLLNDESCNLRAEIIREKGTNRKQFFRGAVDKYSWVDCGSSYLPGELTAAFLWAQLQAANKITDRRMSLWDKYHNAFKDYESKGFIRRPITPPECRHNGHMYYLIFSNLDERTLFINKMKNLGVQCVFHYVPLHSSEYGRKVGRFVGNMSVTHKAADCLVRLPMWIGMESVQDSIINCALDVISDIKK